MRARTRAPTSEPFRTERRADQPLHPMLHPHPRSQLEELASHNRLLNELPPEERSAVLARLERVTVRANQPLTRQGSPVDAVYFPETALVAVDVDGEDVMIVGRDGMLGLAPVLVAEIAPITSVVVVSGNVLRTSADVIAETMDQLPALRALLHRHIGDRIVDLARAGACARAHALPARLATLLLTVREETGSDWLPLTHERIAKLIGSTRRASVTDILSAWGELGIVLRRRGAIAISSVDGLRAVACPCAARTLPQEDVVTVPATLEDASERSEAKA